MKTHKKSDIVILFLIEALLGAEIMSHHGPWNFIIYLTLIVWFFNPLEMFRK